MTDETIDWAAIESRHGPIDQVERNRLEVEGLNQQTAALVNRADWVERMGESTRAEIQEAHAAGKTLDEHYADQQGDVGNWTAEEEERAAGYPGAMPADYQDPGLTQACLSDEAEAIARGVEAREAELDAIEADPDMIGSEAWAAHYWENGGEYADGTHAEDEL